ncbi:hypothetical protein A1O7_09186 [Cladophialophora yegresii CBS 114405]|uniref:Amino acid transporter transmembrane domain-containing protein n=1 Tax=Cladophialophora yegresii CBS 114405 TaxID=1182544 RepID=W9VLJ4_9EURO|nr:uncharacterized protein A1O7_09186 [Cladophialophora yegresii CBS 114405]EXJ53850.1 hypothetical protein A1O7_09186 [Cladophialophora yegresii CBS 114405]
MANSIIGAGVIGQPYAFRQAGTTMGIILLIALTGTGAPGSHSALFGLTLEGKKNTDAAKGSSAPKPSGGEEPATDGGKQPEAGDTSS